MPLASWYPCQMLFFALEISVNYFLVHISTFWHYLCSYSSVIRPLYLLTSKAFSSCSFFFSRLWCRCCRALDIVSRFSILSSSFSSLYSSRKDATSSSSTSLSGRSLFSEYLTVKSSSKAGGFSSVLSRNESFLLRYKNQYTSCRTAWISVWLLPMFLRIKSSRYPHFSISCCFNSWIWPCSCLSLLGRIFPIYEDRKGRIFSYDSKETGTDGDLI